MRQTPRVRWLVVAALGLVVVAYGCLPTSEAGHPVGPIATTAVSGAFGGGPPDKDAERSKVVYVAAPPMSLEATRVWLKLQDKVAMNFPNDTPLEDVKKYVEQVTIDERAGFATGIPIYFDPQGLQDADKTMASTIAINLQGLPLATTLRLILKQLNLTYSIQKDGLVVVTAMGTESEGEASLISTGEANALRAEIQALRQEIQGLKDRPSPKGEQGSLKPGTGGFR